MASVKRCRNCGGTTLETDYSRGNVICLECGQILEEGILVSEVGFAESAGGRVHVQGAFISHNATGFANVRGTQRGGQNTENIKAQGASRIEGTGRQMHLSHNIIGGAKRFFSLAVDNKFNRGRRTDYIIASCLYLQCRLQKDAHMLIDFSERLNINVFELGATYLKLRSILSLLEPMPEVDPAIYNLRFAHRLDFGTSVHSVATDASRLVRRFRADWMTQGRRPAGVCGACLIIAARMSNFLRTPLEVSQVVKVHERTIKKRLLEFAQTEMAKKTVAEWRALTDADLDKLSASERPPAMKEAEAKQLKVERIKAFQEAEDKEGSESEDGDESGDGPRKKRKDDSEEEKMVGGVAAAAHDVESDALAIAEGDEDEDEEDDNLDPLPPSDYVMELEGARDNPEAVRAERRKEKAALMREIKSMKQGNVDPEDLELADLASQAEGLGEDEEEEFMEKADDVEPATQLQSITKAEAEAAAAQGKTENFDAWDDPNAVLTYFQSKFFQGDELLYQGSHMTNRIKMWVGARDPREVIKEVEIVQKARQARERGARARPETEFEDLDDAELEQYYVLEDDERQARARMWLSSNGKWLEEDKERQEKKAALARAKGLDPNKPKNKRKRAAPHKGPYNTATEAIQSFAKGKQFSSRVNYDVLRQLGLGQSEMAGTQGLVSFDDDKDDDGDQGWDEKGDEDW
ncbi:transcription factor IIIB 90 kDa subunit [Kwoniella heveanensis CBS 569]|nr:transcription factor IIIB 90 kDa subunit [Kwoniella heveanensis CBS 569]